MDDIIIPIHKMVGKEPEIDVTDTPLSQPYIKEVYVQIEFRGGSKADQFFTNINDAKEFLETYE